MRSFTLSIFMILLSLTGACHAGWFDGDAGRIVIVQGTSSVGAATEKPLAQRLAKQINTWLTEAGTPHKLLTDDNVSPWQLWRARVVILPYNPQPSPLALKAYERVIRAGGILVVCYGQAPALATLMQFKLEPYQQAKSRTQWASFEFDRSRLPGLPGQVRQATQHLIPIRPDSGQAQVLAYWHDARGNKTPEAAWVQSPAGFWMSHVLQPGDDENKRQLLLAMIATVLPDAWAQATKHRLSLQRPFGEFDSLKTACQFLKQPAPSIKMKPGWEAYTTAGNWLQALTTRYARYSLTNQATLRGVWLDEGACPTPESWPAIATNLHRLKLNTVFFHVGNALTASSATGFRPPSDATLAIHAWLRCLNLEGATPDQLQLLREQNRLQVSETGTTLDWLCPSHPLNRELLAHLAGTLARDTAFAGIHLDYIRYLNRHACYCPGCRQRFEHHQGQPVTSWPATVYSGPLAHSYRIWRAAQISACVETITQTVRAVNPALKVSAAVYGATPACFDSVGQEWPEWLNRNSVDFVCPMNYTPDLKAFQALLRTQSALPHATRIYPGVGLASTQSQLAPDQLVAQLIQIQRANFAGFAIFEYNDDMLKTNW